MKHTKKLALLLLVLTLLVGVFSVFAGAAATTVDSGLYDGSNTFVPGTSPANSYNSTIVTDGDEAYYVPGSYNNYMDLGYDVKSPLGGDYRYFTAELDFRAKESLADQKAKVFLIARNDANGFAGCAVDVTIAQTSEDATSATLTLSGKSVTFPNLTEWHRLEFVVRLPYYEGETFTDNSEIQVFLDGEKVLTKTGGALNSGVTKFCGLRMQHLTTDADFNFDNIRLRTWATGDYARAEVNGMKYAEFADAFAAAEDGDTVTLYENMGEAVAINKNLTVNTNGKTFLYTTAQCNVTKDGTVYTFVKDTTPAILEIVVDGKVAETLHYSVGAVPEILNTEYYLYNDGGSLLKITSRTVETDGVEISDFTAITSDMRGKTVRLTLEGTEVAVTVSKADGTVDYITDNTFAALKAAVAAAPTDSVVTLYRDYDDVSDQLIFNGFNNNNTSSVSFDLNGHRLTTAKQLYGAIYTRCELYLYSSRKGGGITTAESARQYILNGGAWGKTLYVGITKSGKTFDKENLSLTGANLYIASNTNVSLDAHNMTYTARKGDSYALIQSAHNTKITVKIDGCDLIELSDNKKPLFGASTKDTNGASCNVTVTNTNIFTQSATLVNVNYIPTADATNKDTFTVTLGKGTVLVGPKNLQLSKTNDNTTINLIFADGVRLSNLQETAGVSLSNSSSKEARISPTTVTFGEKTYTLSYLVTSDHATLTFIDGTARTEEAWVKGETPEKENISLFGDYYKTYGTLAKVDGDATYTTKVRSTVSKISGNLTLYANITFNLYFRKDGFIKGVAYNEGTVTKNFTDEDVVLIGGEEYYLFRLDGIAPRELSEAFRLDVSLEGTEESYTVMTSLVKYAASVLKSEESTEGKTLVLALLDYVRETSVSLGQVQEEFAGIRAIDACLKQYGYERRTWTKPEEIENPASGDITGAALELVNTPGFAFFLDETKYADKDEVTVRVNGVAKAYKITHTEAGKHYFTVDSIHVSNYRKDLTITLGEQTFTYNFDIYMTGFGENVPAYAHALYAYSVAAESYLASQSGN